MVKVIYTKIAFPRLRQQIRKKFCEALSVVRNIIYKWNIDNKRFECNKDMVTWFASTNIHKTDTWELTTILHELSPSSKTKSVKQVAALETKQLE